MKGGKLTVAIVLSAFCVIFGAQARKVRLSMPDPEKNMTSSMNGTIAVDSISDSGYDPGQISVTKYDKPAASDVETMFVSNGTDRTLLGIMTEISYRDMSGALLHRRAEFIRVSIPAGETRMVSLRSWDKQKSFHFHTSRKARRVTTPYKVDISVGTIYLAK